MTVNIERLKKVSEHLRRGQLGHDQFDFSCISGGRRKPNGCGTLGCALGELPVIFPEQWKMDQEHDLCRRPVLNGDVLPTTTEACGRFFGLTDGEVDHLFFPIFQNTDRYGGKTLYGNATREQVADNIDAFIEKCGQPS